jgi:hypothetical protein
LTKPYSEFAVVLGEAENLVAIGTRPTRPSGGSTPAVVFLNSGIIHRIGPDRLYVRLARALAEAGALAFRLDFSGIGDSGAPAHPSDIHRSEAEQREVTQCLDFIQETEGVDRMILIGLCSGGDNALLGLARDSRVVGGVLLDPFAFKTWGYYLRYYGPRVFNPAVWWRSLTGQSPFLKILFHAVRKRLARGPKPKGNRGPVRGGEAPPESPGAAMVSLPSDKPEPEDLTRPTRPVMRRTLEKVIARGGRLLYVFTAGLQPRYYYRNQFFDAFPGLDFDGQVEFEYYPDCDHTFTRQALQERLEERVVRWFRTNFRDSEDASDAGGSAEVTAEGEEEEEAGHPAAAVGD